MTETFRPDYLLPGTRIGDYSIHHLLGAGSSSAVYEVRSRDGNPFAMKVSKFRPEAPSSKAWLMDRRFTRSIACLEALRGVKNVAQIYAHDRYPDPLSGWQYLVQELVPGGQTLIDWARRTSPTLREVAHVFRQLALACGEMAHAEIRHRDLKPANILKGAGGVPKVIDFDSAICFRAEDLTGPLASDVPGTLAYLSPEHCVAILKERAGKPVSPFFYLPTSDLHALGAIFYEIFTGRHPFAVAGQTEEELLKQIANQVPARPAELNPQVPFVLDEAVMYLLSKDPALRCQNGDDLVVLLKRGEANVGNASWDVLLRVGEPAPLAPAVVLKSPVPIRSFRGEGHQSEQVVERQRPPTWVAACVVTLGVAAVLLVGSQRWGSRPAVEGISGGTPFDLEAPALSYGDTDDAGVPTGALAGAADAATVINELVLRGTLITGPLPGQKMGPCDKTKDEVKYKGACWRIIHTERSCDGADIYEPVVGYCKKYRARYEPVYIEKKEKKPGTVVEPISPDAPILQDAQP